MKGIARKVWNVLEEEHPDTISPTENYVRHLLTMTYRFAFATFLGWHLFDFLFSAIWMHGYIWSLNLPIDLDMSDKSAGSIVYHQLTQVGFRERIVHAFISVSSITTLLICSGYCNGRGKNVWSLFRFSLLVGVVAAFVRTLQLKQRLFSSLHEGFYCYFAMFLIGIALTIKFAEKFPVVSKEEMTSISKAKKSAERYAKEKRALDDESTERDAENEERAENKIMEENNNDLDFSLSTKAL